MLNKSMHNAKIKDGKERIIEGWISRISPDEEGDITHYDAFDKHLDIFFKNPTLFFGHAAWDKPIGKVLSLTPVKDEGVWGKVQIAKGTINADEAWTLIEQDMLKAFSFGFEIMPGGYHFDNDGYRHLTNIKLIEVSLVSLGMHREALREKAQEKGIQIKSLIAPDQPGAEKKENQMEKTLKEVTNQVGILETDLKKNVTTVEDAKQKIAAIQTAVEELKARPEGVKEADLKALQEKSQKDLMEAVNKLNETIDQKTVVPPGMDHDLGSIEQAKRLGFTKGLDDPDVFKSKVISVNHEKAATRLGMNSQKHILQELQEKSDDLFIVGAMLGMIQSDGAGGVQWKSNPTRLRTFREYNTLLAEVHKALDTATSATGGSWLPTGYSAILQEGMELKRGVIAKMRRFNMPQNPYVFPLKTARATPYLFSEAISDNQVNTITASTPATSNITFTAQGIAVAVWNSKESEEDLIIAVLPMIKDDILKAMKNGEEYAVINGDNATTHQDTDHAAESAIVVAKAFDGLRLDALANAGKDASGTLTYALLVSLLEKAGKYGIAPGYGFFISSIAAYYKALALTQVTGYDAFGASAVVAKGALPRILGHELVPTENMRQDLGPVGVNAASDNVHTAIIYVNPDGWLIGDRRNYTVEQATYPLTQQRVTVATQRLDMQKMVPSSDTCTSILYNITT